MKTGIKNPLVHSVLIAVFGLIHAGRLSAQTFTTLHSFTAPSGPYPGTNSDGANPYAGLILSGNTLYGTALIGGSSGNGTVFAVNTDGTGFTNLHSFTGGSDGSNPYDGLVLSNNTLHGTTYFGGISGNGTVFALNTGGSGFTNLYSFNYASDGANPVAGLISFGNILYGTTQNGGSSGNGTVFAVNTNGTGFTNLHNFTGSDGAQPLAGLVLSGNTLYGTTEIGGISDKGTVFAVNTDGTGFTILHSFTATANSYPYGNSDGANPWAGLILSGNTLYGTAQCGGSSGKGTVFSLSFRPQLTITLSDTNVILMWPTNFVGFDYTGYTLQSATNLVSPVWTTNSPAPIVVNGQNTVTNPISGAQQFFRLSQ